MESKKLKLLFEEINELRDNAASISPESFSLVAKTLFSIEEEEAQMLLNIYQNFCRGNWVGLANDKLFAMVKRADIIAKQVMYLKSKYQNMTSIETYLGKYDYYNNNLIAVYSKTTDDKIIMSELKLSNPQSYEILYKMMSNGQIILAIIKKVDELEGSLERCDNSDKRLNVYDGDVFVSYNEGKYNNYWNRPNENGVYVAHDGAYRRLLYTYGRGYINGDERPNTADDGDKDNDDVFTFDSHRYSKYILTLNHTFRRIGNIHVDINFLKEKKGEGNENR